MDQSPAMFQAQSIPPDERAVRPFSFRNMVPNFCLLQPSAIITVHDSARTRSHPQRYARRSFFRAGTASNPGMVQADGWEVRAFLPQAMDAAAVVGGMAHPMRKTRSEGFFVATLQRRSGGLQAALTLWNGAHVDIEDPYRFPPLISDFDLHIHGEGTQYESYRTMGAHSSSARASQGVRFAVWARTPKWSAWSATSTIGTSAAIPCACATAASGKSSFPGVGRGHELQVFRACALARLSPAEVPIPTASARKCRPKSASIVWRSRQLTNGTTQQWMDARAHSDHAARARLHL